jgi:predicted nucleic acid-binding Zn ribbon protein
MESLANKFSEILRWERRKRREQTLAIIACVTLALAILFLPVNGFLPRDWLRWTVPAVLFMVLAPGFFYRTKWRYQNSARAVAALDKELNLAECAVTAWEITGGAESGGAKLLVLQRAEARLRNIEPRQILPRSVTWPMYGVMPLLLLWLALLWLDFDRPGSEGRRLSPGTLAEKVRE